jgi:hypothetical protein
VIMYRRALELLAADRGVKVRNLAEALKKLQEMSEIDRRPASGPMNRDWLTTTLRTRSTTAFPRWMHEASMT